MGQIYTINDLPKYSKWPEILIGSDNQRAERVRSDIHREFEVEKWGKLLMDINQSEKVLTIEDVDNLHINTSVKSLVYQNNKLELTTIGKAQKNYVELIAKYLEPYLNECSAIVDLGCGYGSVILKLAQKSKFKEKQLYACDYSQSGIDILEKTAYFNEIEIKTGICNFLDDDILKIEVPKHALFFTSYSIFYQKRFSQNFLKNILQYKPIRVINVEPCYEHYETSSLWGLLSKKYIEYNQYNLDMLTYLKEYQNANTIKIDDVQKLVHGINPLLIASIINWKPVTNN